LGIAALCTIGSWAQALGQTAAAGQNAAHVQGGEHLFKQYCSGCHSVEPARKLVGPSLHAEMKGPSPKKIEARVRETIQNGKGAMPPFGPQLGNQDIDDLVSYLKAH
jgi:mono/diheme cytochrome c family protein